jgi:hypothetical protein
LKMALNQDCLPWFTSGEGEGEASGDMLTFTRWNLGVAGAYDGA